MFVVQDDSRLLLFKMPTSERLGYRAKLLEILASPPNMIVEMGTYRRRWIPSEVYDHPGSLNNKLAWVICIDQLMKEKEVVGHRFIPVREVKVVQAKTEGENLLLWLETRGFLRCDDHDKFKEEFVDKIPSPPPGEGRFIALDIDIHGVTCASVVDPVQHDATNECWRKIAEGFANMQVCLNAFFYRVVGISERKKKAPYLETSEETSSDGPSRSYQIKTDKIYNLDIYYWLPQRQFDLCPQDLTVSTGGWLKVYDECTMKDRIGTMRVPIKALTDDQYPYECPVGVSIAAKSDEVVGPSVKLPIRLLREGWWTKLRRNGLRIILLLLLAALFYVGLTDILPKTYGTLASTFSVVMIPVLTQLLLTRNH